MGQRHVLITLNHAPYGSIYYTEGLRAVVGITSGIDEHTVDVLYLEALRHLGVNRLALGAQSLRDDELRTLGRIHTTAQAHEAYRAARQACFDNVNIDLIYDLKPWQPGDRMQPGIEGQRHVAAGALHVGHAEGHDVFASWPPPPAPR
jgi:hypothetical protein